MHHVFTRCSDDRQILPLTECSQTEATTAFKLGHFMVQLPAVFAIALAALIAFPGCNSKSTSTASSPATVTNSLGETASDSPKAPKTEQSVTLPKLGLVPQFSLVDQKGASFTNASVANKTWVANFIFTRCTATCPKQTSQLAQLQKRLAASEANNIHFVSISVDPEYDTPEIMKKYASVSGANEASWSFLTGTRDQTWALSKDGFMLAVGEAPENEAMPLFHSSKLVLVDRAGNLRGFYEAMDDAEVAKLESDLLRLSSAAVPTSAEATTPSPGAEAVEEEIEVESGAFSFSDLQADEPNENQPQRIYSPQQGQIDNPGWMVAREEAQRRDVQARLKAFYDFQFEDRFPSSGITFSNEVVEDAAKAYKAAHYDHGNGVAIGDVDGDGQYDVYFTTQLGGNALYRNLGNGTFEDITAHAGVALADKISVSASFADMDNDGDPDLFVTTVRGGNHFFENTGDGKFKNITSAAGLTYENGHSSSAVMFDYDNDGLLDLFVTNVGKFTTEEIGPGNYYIARTAAFAGHLQPELTETSKLYRNLGDLRFEDVTSKTGLIDDSWSGAATPIDVNGDGWLDLYTLDMQGNDEYFENVGGKKFAKRSREVFPKTPWGSMGVKVFDFDNDGRQDMFISDMHSDMSEKVGPAKEKLKANMQFPESMLKSDGMSIFGNAFFHRQPDNTFVEISDAIGAENYWPWGLSVGDLNADGWDDVFLASSMNLQFRYGVNTVLLNNQGKGFVDSEFVVGVEPRRDGVSSKLWYTLDAEKDAEHSFIKKTNFRTGEVEVWGALGSRSSVIFDLDDDGDLDIVTNECHSVPLVLINNLTEKKDVRFVKVKLIGTKSNREGLGATVTVKAADKQWVKVHDGQSGYLSQSSMPLYFGLGDQNSVDEIVVKWPSGKTQSMKNAQTNSLVVIEENN